VDKPGEIDDVPHCESGEVAVEIARTRHCCVAGGGNGLNAKILNRRLGKQDEVEFLEMLTLGCECRDDVWQVALTVGDQPNRECVTPRTQIEQGISTKAEHIGGRAPPATLQRPEKRGHPRSDQLSGCLQQVVPQRGDGLARSCPLECGNGSSIFEIDQGEPCRVPEVGVRVTEGAGEDVQAAIL
jgi:hypothetical protein